MRVSIALAAVICLTLAARAIEPVTHTIDVLDLIKTGAVEYHINPNMDLHDAPSAIWTLQPDGTLHTSGRGYGYIATKDSYRDYHLVLEYKWGDKTWGKRQNAARDNGLLLHAHGPHGAYSDTWMASIECQIIEGGTGDILVLSPKLPNGTELLTTLTSEYTLDRDQEKIWTPGSPRQPVTKGRINWQHRDPDWADKKGYRGRQDTDSPSGEWNRLEVIAQGDTLQYLVNGVKVNQAFDCNPSQGRICLQTEGAEMIVRRYQLHPLHTFKETWTAIQASGGMDHIDVVTSRDTPWSPEKSQAAIQLDGPYEAQLVACEPLVRDPVEVTWDDAGRLYVADTIDYPLGNPAGGKHLSRIQQLIDDNHDGRMDRAITFADDLDFVQGLLPYNGGLIATTRTEVLFLKDTDHDGKADKRQALIKGFNPKHAQLQVSAPRWGLDNCIYFCNGIDSKEIYPTPDAPTAPDSTATVNVSRTNFRWDPATHKIEPVSGFGQFGGAFDDWGHHFTCSNRNPVMFAVMPYEAVIRNPHAGITEGWETIAPSGSDSRVYPLIRSHTTADAHAGTNTAACGLGVYRGDLMPELKNNVFTCDPTGQLVSRYKIQPNGASLQAIKQGDHTEFFRSRDEWTRPVSITTGPDGAIYICDMYRQYIDHARFFPEDFVKAHDMRKGENEGRLWRIVPKGAHYAQAGSTRVPRVVFGVPPKTPSAARTRTASQGAGQARSVAPTTRQLSTELAQSGASTKRDFVPRPALQNATHRPAQRVIQHSDGMLIATQSPAPLSTQRSEERCEASANISACPTPLSTQRPEERCEASWPLSTQRPEERCEAFWSAERGTKLSFAGAQDLLAIPSWMPLTQPAPAPRYIATNTTAKAPIIRPITAAPKDIAGLVAWLGHQNAWQRETAQRLLVSHYAPLLDEYIGYLNTNIFNAPAALKEELKAFWSAATKQPTTPRFLLALFATYAGIDRDRDLFDDFADKETRTALATAGNNDSQVLQLRLLTRMRPAWATGAVRPLVSQGEGSNIFPCDPPSALHKFVMKWFEKGDARLLMLAAACNDTGADTDTIETLLRRFSDDVWVQKTLLANSPNTAGRYLALLIKAQPRDWNYTPQRAEFVKSLSRCCGTDGFDLTDLLALLKSTAGQPAWWKFAILQGLSEGLPRRTNDTYPNAKSLTQLATMKLEGMEIAQAEITTLLAQADNTIADPSAPLDQRLAVLPLLAQRPQAQLEPILTTLLAADQPAELQAAAIAVVKKLSVKKLAPLLYQLLPTLGPVSKREVIATLITANPIEVMTKMEHGEISKSLADAEKRWALLKTGSADTRALAERVFGKPSEDRAAVIADYASTLTLKGASKNGHLIFQSICIACHKVRGEGNDIGPDITDVRTKAPEALLSDILDPNRMCETRWSAYQIDTKDGKILVGLVAAETTSGVTLKGPGLNEEVPRSNIAKMTSLDRTLMPPGLEAAINKQQMADLLAFLRGE